MQKSVPILVLYIDGIRSFSVEKELEDFQVTCFPEQRKEKKNFYQATRESYAVTNIQGVISLQFFTF